MHMIRRDGGNGVDDMCSYHTPRSACTARPDRQRAVSACLLCNALFGTWSGSLPVGMFKKCTVDVPIRMLV
jgi:hypothetical protein